MAEIGQLNYTDLAAGDKDEFDPRLFIGESSSNLQLKASILDQILTKGQHQQ